MPAPLHRSLAKQNQHRLPGDSMPSLTFVLPHWVYWLGLLLFPVAAMTLAQRQSVRKPDTGASLPVAIMLLVTGGFVGLHRLYLRSRVGLIYIPLFLAILFSNIQERQARDLDSDANRQVVLAEIKLERLEAASKADPAAAKDRLTEARDGLADLRENFAGARATRARWHSVAGAFAIAIALFMLVDAALLPRMVKRSRSREDAAALAAVPVAPLTGEVPPGPEDPAAHIHTPITNAIDSTNEWVGNFVAYWSIIAVFVYYYEVIARYVFNSPTNWAHESMFLMFGMQYLLAGGFAYREDSHVRVDVIYSLFPARVRAKLDIVTSAFFFIFAGTLLWTGLVFALRSIDVFEVSFTEWAIQYWPVKSMIALGAFLILLQGVSRLIKDIVFLRRGVA